MVEKEKKLLVSRYPNFAKSNLDRNYLFDI
jgi:hypothetical protein